MEGENGIVLISEEVDIAAFTHLKLHLSISYLIALDFLACSCYLRSKEAANLLICCTVLM